MFGVQGRSLIFVYSHVYSHQLRLFLEFRFNIFSAKIQTFSAFMFLVFACITNTASISLTSKRRRAPRASRRCSPHGLTVCMCVLIGVLRQQGRCDAELAVSIFIRKSRSTVLLTATLLTCCNVWRFKPLAATFLVFGRHPSLLLLTRA